MPMPFRLRLKAKIPSAYQRYKLFPTVAVQYILHHLPGESKHAYGEMAGGRFGWSSLVKKDK